MVLQKLFSCKSNHLVHTYKTIDSANSVDILLAEFCETSY